MAIAERLDGERVTLRRAHAPDATTVADVINSPGVVEWWTEQSPDEVRDAVSSDDEAFVIYCIELDGETVGIVQYGVETDPQYSHGNIDIAVMAPHHRTGLATDAIRTLARHLVDDLHLHRIVIDPAAHNTAAIACYTALGFRPVGVMRNYERGADGSFHDGLLMDLLADELR